MNSDNKNLFVVCNEIYDSVFKWLIGYALIFAVIGINCYSVLMIYRNRTKIPIRQRAPWLAITHAILYALTVFIPTLAELTVKFGKLDWDSDGSTEIPFMRRFYKAISVAVRVMLPVMLPFRYLVSLTIECS